MNNKEFSRNLEKRTRIFAYRILKLASKLPNTPEAKTIMYQLSKAGTSIGANYREVNRSRSKADFINKIRICEGESSETVFWLEIILDQEWLKSSEIEHDLSEGNELLTLFTKIGSTSRN